MSLASIIRWLFFFSLVIAAPMFLALGTFSLGVNEIYVWYIMHPKSLVFALGSLVCITLLYVISIPGIFKIFFGRTEERGNRSCSAQEHIPHHDVVHMHDPVRRNDNILESVLSLALQSQLNQTKDSIDKVKNKQEKDEIDCSIHFAQLRQIDKLKEDKIITDDEFSMLKNIILEAIFKEFENKKKN